MKKCKDCKKRDIYMSHFGLIFILAMIISWISPFNIKHGYSMNWDIMSLMIFTLSYYIYLWRYNNGKVKGTFVFVKS